LDVTGEREGGQGPVRIDFSQSAMDLLDGLRPGDGVSVRFTVRGVAYGKDGRKGHLVTLQGAPARGCCQGDHAQVLGQVTDEPGWETSRWPSSMPSLTDKKAWGRAPGNEEPPF